MNEWRKILIPPYMSIKEAIEVINITSLQIALVIDENNKLLGTVTDGDVRRGIIKEISLDDVVRTDYEYKSYYYHRKTRQKNHIKHHGKKAQASSCYR